MAAVENDDDVEYDPEAVDRRLTGLQGRVHELRAAKGPLPPGAGIAVIDSRGDLVGALIPPADPSGDFQVVGHL